MSLETATGKNLTDPLIARRFVRLRHVMLMAVVAAVGCSSSGEVASLAPPDPSEVEEVVADPIGRVVSVEEAALATPRVDVHGNSINVHGWASWPASIDELDPVGSGVLNLVGELTTGREPGTSIVAIDVEVCASQDQATGSELLQARFGLSSDSAPPDQTDGDLRTSMIFQPVVHPTFMWPAAGDCQRGWQALAWTGPSAPSRAGFTAVSMAEESFGDRWVYEWRLGDSGPVPAPAAVEGALAFTDGVHAGWQTSFIGWSEVPSTVGQRDPRNREYFQPRDGQRLVATLVEVCAAPADPSAPPVLELPVFALQVEDWTLIAPAPAGDVWGPGFDPVGVPSPDACTRGWVPFEVPDSVEVSGLFATDRYLLGRPHASWAFGAPIPPPQTGAGFPNAILVETAQAQCGATEPLELVRVGAEPEEWMPRAMVAVREGDGRMAIYGSVQTLSADDIPEPSELDLEVLKVVVDNGLVGEVLATEYRDDFSNSAYGGISLLDGSRPGTFMAFLGATVIIDEINENFVCLTVSNDRASPSVAGRLAAPIWAPS